jgi:cell division protein FtsI (penicillin-binding protein 3)
MQPVKSKRRIYATGILMLGIACFFVFRLFSLHFSDKIRLRTGPGEPDARGMIQDRNGSVLALSIERESLFAVPGKVADPGAAAERLAPILGISRDVLEERMSRKREFVWLKRKLSDGEAAQVRALAIPGVSFRKELHRVYPQGPLAANIIGFVGVENRGLAGVEYKFDQTLSGWSVTPFEGPDDGRRECHHIMLTIDRFVQYQAEKAIEDAVTRFGARQGSVLVMQVKTGRVLAIAKFPSFDPNTYHAYSDVERNSYTVTDSFEPGSTLKIIAMALLLELFPDFNREFTCTGYVEVAGERINCVGVHGVVRPPDIIRYSCNAGIIQAMRLVRKQQYYDMLRRFGFGARVGVELPGESEGLLRPLNAWSGLSKYSTAIGQEISVTSLQMAAAFAAIGNGGVYMAPSVIESVRTDGGAPIRNFFPRAKGRVISASVARKLMEMMRLVVESGTGGGARIRFYIVVGKTGTGQKSSGRGGYTDRVTASFVGLAPFDNPELCIIAVIDEPAGNAGGGAAAAPVFARVAERVMPYLGIGSSPVQVPGAVRRTERAARRQVPALPDFRGLTLAQAVESLTLIQRQYNVTYSLHGRGRVFFQSPAPGSALAHSVRIRLHFREE